MTDTNYIDWEKARIVFEDEWFNTWKWPFFHRLPLNPLSWVVFEVWLLLVLHWKREREREDTICLLLLLLLFVFMYICGGFSLANSFITFCAYGLSPFDVIALSRSRPLPLRSLLAKEIYVGLSSSLINGTQELHWFLACSSVFLFWNKRKSEAVLCYVTLSPLVGESGRKLVS